MKRAAVLLALVCGVFTYELSPTATDYLLRSQFESWKIKFGKNYKTQQEENLRFKNFIDSIERVTKRNSDVFGLTKFSDMSVEEFKSTMLTLKGFEVDSSLPVHKPTVTSTPSSFDWRDYNAITPVKKIKDIVDHVGHIQQ